jgi:fatty acyl-CoA reductase
MRDPFPGWVEFRRAGFVGLNLALSLGVLRVIYTNPEMKSEFIPVDFCANAMIASIANLIQNPQEAGKVINCISSAQSRFTVSDFFEIGQSAVHLYPSKNMIYYPTKTITKHYPIFLFYFIFYQLLPSIFVDLMLLLSGKKPRLVRVQREIYGGQMGICYFVLNEWNWKNDNLLKLFDGMSDADK